jgi:hypothetical protein
MPYLHVTTPLGKGPKAPGICCKDPRNGHRVRIPKAPTYPFFQSPYICRFLSILNNIKKVWMSPRYHFGPNFSTHDNYGVNHQVLFLVTQGL